MSRVHSRLFILTPDLHRRHIGILSLLQARLLLIRQKVNIGCLLMKILETKNRVVYGVGIFYLKTITNRIYVPYTIMRTKHFYSHCDVSLCTRAHSDVFHVCPLVPPNHIVSRGSYQSTVLCLILILMRLLV